MATKRGRKAKPDPMEMGEQHGRCRWEGLREQDRLIAGYPPQVIAKQRRRCRQWLAGEITWAEVLGEP